MSIASLIEPGVGTFGNIVTLLTEGLATYTGLPQPVAVGYEYETYTVLYSGSNYSLAQGAGAALGDVFKVASVTSPSGYTNVVNPDGTGETLLMGDTSRQSFQWSVYRVATNSIDALTTTWINEVGAIWTGPVFVRGTVGFSIGTIDLTQYASSPSGDTLQFILAGSLPNGVSLSSGLISGTPTVFGTFNFTVSATDITGTSTTSPLSSIVIPQPAQAVVSAVVRLPPFPKVSFRSFSWLEMAERAWGSEYRQPDKGIYAMSDGRRFDSTDMYQTGIYRRP